MSVKKGYKFPNSFGEKISKARLERKKKLGYLNSPETREKISQKLIGRPAPLGCFKKGNKINLGRKHSEETKIKFSLIQKLINHPKEYFKKMSNLGLKKLWGNYKKPMHKCEICNKEFYRPLANLKNHIFCSNECEGKWRSITMKKNIINRKYPFNFIEKLKELIRKRDQYKCQECGAPQEEFTYKLCIHHKDKDKNNLNPENLISLCKPCHSRMHLKERILLLKES